jgi:hypothetical protein
MFQQGLRNQSYDSQQALLGAPGRMVVISVVAVFAASYAVGMNHIPEIIIVSSGMASGPQ